MSEEINVKENLQSLFEEHDFNKSYKQHTIVLYPIDEEYGMFVSKLNVPKRTNITNTKYWKAIDKKAKSIYKGKISNKENNNSDNPYANYDVD